MGTPVSGGARVQRSLRTKNFKAAQIEKRRLLVELRGLDPKASTALFQDVAQEILQTKKGQAKKTYVQAELHLRYLNSFFGPMKVSTIDESLWEQYRQKCKKEKPDRELGHDKRFFVMVMKRAFFKGLVRRRLEIPKGPPSEPIGRHLSEDEIKRLLDCANPTLKTQIIMALTMGMRRSEILKLTWDRVDLVKKTIYLRAQDTKMRKARSFPISTQALQRLLLIDERTEKGPVFPSRYDIAVTMNDNKTAWQACKRRAGVECRFHDLRHTFFTRAFKSNVSPALICEYGGLSMSVAQKVYLHYKPEDMHDVAGLVSV